MIEKSIDSVKSFAHFNAIETKKFFLIGNCDECVIAGQNVFLGPTIHLPRPEFYFESHHLYLTHVVYHSFRIGFQKTPLSTCVPHVLNSP